jgi:hypothetical protein
MIEPAISPELVAKHGLTPHREPSLGSSDRRLIFERMIQALQSQSAKAA